MANNSSKPFEGSATDWLNKAADLANRLSRPLQNREPDLQKKVVRKLAHDLRGPLGIMQIDLDLALRGKAGSRGDARELIESNLREIAKMRQILESFTASN